MDDANTLNVHIHALRQELSKYTAIKTVWGLGYKMEKTEGKYKKLYIFSGVSSFDSTNDFGRFLGSQRMLIEK